MHKDFQQVTTELYGLIGFPLSHSFSKAYFTEKFQQLNLDNHIYELFPLENFSEDFPNLIRNTPNLKGLNVTIPFKETVIPFLDDCTKAVRSIGAVNCIKIQDGKLYGFNTDVYGFEMSLVPILHDKVRKSALVLGTGGSSKAVHYVLNNLGFDVFYVSRFKGKGDYTYEDLDKSIMKEIGIIVNCTPVGMYPEDEKFPDIPYNDLHHDHILFDLVYNPEKTLFLQLGEEKKCTVKNGWEMLSLQAEKSWEIWKNLENRFLKA